MRRGEQKQNSTRATEGVMESH